MLQGMCTFGGWQRCSMAIYFEVGVMGYAITKDFIKMYSMKHGAITSNSRVKPRLVIGSPSLFHRLLYSLTNIKDFQNFPVEDH